MAIHNLDVDNTVFVVDVEDFGLVNVRALRRIFDEVELAESLSVQDDFDRGYSSAIGIVRNLLESYVVNDNDSSSVDVVVHLDSFGQVKVDVLKAVKEEIAVQSVVSIQNDWDTGYSEVFSIVQRILKSSVVKSSTEVVSAGDAPFSAAWEAGRDAGVENQLNWDGWNYSKEEIKNPYLKTA